MSAPASHQVTLLLREWKAGDQSALEKVTPLIYTELHRLANSYLRRERPDHTLQPTALVNEAYLRLVDQRTPDWQNRAHFFGVAAQLMRQVLVDYARSHRSEKRGAGAKILPLDEALTFTEEKAESLLLLDEALNKLAKVDPRKYRAVELRFFGGLTIEEIANVMDLSVATIGRELRMAEAWLYRETSQA